MTSTSIIIHGNNERLYILYMQVSQSNSIQQMEFVSVSKELIQPVNARKGVVKLASGDQRFAMEHMAV